MFDPEIIIDIRVIKFQDYIRRKPNRPFGYYGLGVQYMLSGKPAMADKMFMQALKVDPCYVPAKLGKLEFLLSQKRFGAAARYYNKNKDLFCRKKISKTRINRITSRLYVSKYLNMRKRGLYSQLLLKENIIALNRIQNKTSNNPVTNILLSAFRLKDGRGDEKAIKLYRYCVELDEISDKLRWDLLQALAKKDLSLLFSNKIAGLFSAIPENAFGTDYADLLLKTFISLGNEKKVIYAFSCFQEKHLAPCTKTLWRYLFFCSERNILNSSLSYCCQKLISAGWIDRLLTTAIKDLYKKGLWENTREMDKFLSLYEHNLI